MSLSRFLIPRRGVDRVVVCEILNRLKANRHFEITLADFQQRVNSTNELLKAARSDSPNSIMFWKHAYQLGLPKSLKPDGTHLNDYGMQKLHDSIYRTIWFHLQHVIGKAQ
jgi:lysophospholipase L1-like esterase